MKILGFQIKHETIVIFASPVLVESELPGGHTLETVPHQQDVIQDLPMGAFDGVQSTGVGENTGAPVTVTVTVAGWWSRMGC